MNGNHYPKFKSYAAAIGSRLRAKRVLVVKATLATTAAIMMSVLHAGAAADGCPLNIVVDVVEGGTACAYRVVVAPINVTLQPKSWLELPTEAMVTFWSNVLPGGFIIEGAYRNEGKRKFSVKLTLPRDAENYTVAHAYTYEWSKTRVRFTQWVIKDHEAVFYWQMKKGGIAGPRGWYKGGAIVTYVRDGYEVKPEEVQAIERAAAGDISTQLQRQAAKKAAAKPKPQSGHGRPWRREVV